MSNPLGAVSRRLAFVALVGVLALVGISFARVALASYQLAVQKTQLQDQVAALKAENAELQTQLTSLQTDAEVERLARQELGWTRPGDTEVVVLGLPTPGVTPTAAATPITAGTGRGP